MGTSCGRESERIVVDRDSMSRGRGTHQTYPRPPPRVAEIRHNTPDAINSGLWILPSLFRRPKVKDGFDAQRVYQRSLAPIRDVSNHARAIDDVGCHHGSKGDFAQVEHPFDVTPWRG